MDDLNEFLNSKDCLNTKEDSTNSFQFDVNTERSAVANTQIRTLSANKIIAGTITVALGLGTSNIILDGANTRIVVNDGTNDRILIGYQLNGF